MPAPNQSILPSTQFREYTSGFPILAATLIADLGGLPNALEVRSAGTLTVRQLNTTSRVIAVSADWYRPIQISEITSHTGGSVIAYRSPE